MDDRYCFVTAARVTAEQKVLGELDVRSRSGLRIGELAGFVLDPANRRVRYAVFRHGWLGRRRFLVPVEDLRLDVERQVLLVDCDQAELECCAAFHAREYPAFSDDDLMTVLFGRDVAGERQTSAA
jgi:hypothetical protein